MMILAVILSGAIGVSLGLLGGGGSILAVPVLVYVAGVEAKAAIGMSLAIVGATSLAGSLLHLRKGRLDLRAALLFSSSGIPAAFAGAKLTHLVPGPMLLLLFAALMLIVASLMLTRKDKPQETPAPASLPKTLAAGAAVGGLTGFLGVGGGFLIVPALVLFAGLPMHTAVGTSLLAIAINSAAGFVSHLGESPLDLPATAEFTASAILGVLAGSRLSARLPAARLRKAFALFVLGVAIFLLAMNCRALF